jgi:uncharacterized protein (DUF1697 family)
VTTFVALLRGINVGGRKPVAMAALRDLLVRLGFAEARTLLQSGNLVFRTTGKTGAHLERLLEAEAATRLGLETHFFVRSADEWHAIVAHNPFGEEAKRDPARLVVVALKEAPDPRAVTTLQAAIIGREVVRARGREAYIVYPDGQGRSKLTNALIEKTLGTRGTARNWNTVLKLDGLVNPRTGPP